MDIKDILTDGKIDVEKIYRHIANSRLNFEEDLQNIIEAINAHIAGLKQETPITPELLERAGFVNSKESKRNESWRKGDLGVLYANGDFCLWVSGRRFSFTRTMEALSVVYNGLHDESLNWQHDPAAELRKRLEAMGFKSNIYNNNYFIILGGVRFVAELDSSLNLSVLFGTHCQAKTGIKTIDALERVVKELRGE